MKNPLLRFETVPLAEVLKKRAAQRIAKNVEKLMGKEGPYVVHEREERTKRSEPRDSKPAIQVGEHNAKAGFRCRR